MTQPKEFLMTTISRINDAQDQGLKDEKGALDPSWMPHLKEEFNQPYMSDLRKFLMARKKNGAVIYPKFSEIFRALNTTHFENVKVVILGQDPYHGPGQAHGLCFSVQEGTAFPPSLQNIFKELKSDLGIEAPQSGDLSRWAKQGVLLLNSVLTVEQGQAAAHQGKGWEKFTDKIIEVINSQKDHVAFILWGAYAQKKAAMVDRNRHFVIESPHPSPLSSHRGFFGSKPFSKVNDYLRMTGQSSIDW